VTAAGEFAGSGAERPRSATLVKGVMLRTALLVTAVFAALASGPGAAVCEDLGCLTLNTPGQATGGGQVAGELAELAILRGTSAGGRANFGFNAQFGSGDPAPSGHLTFIDHDLKKNVKSTSIESFLVAGAMAMFSGRATVNQTPGVAFSVEVEDLGEPGRADTFRITLSDGYMASGVLLHGNIQVREGEPPPDDGEPPAILAGAAKVNITPFTLTDELMSCRSDPACPYQSIVSLSNPDASNPDGLPGGLFASIGAEMARAAASTQWIGPAGAWGEEFTDANTNGRYDAGETFADDPANSSTVVGAGHPSTLGDPVSSTGKWDGIYIAGYGNDRVALGAFDPLWARVLFLRDTRTGTSVAWVSLDLLGYFSDFVGRIRERLRDDLDVDEIILTHTHDHEAPDTHVGIWGEEMFRDGTYPRYEIYIEAKIAQAIEQAAGNLERARFRFGAIRPGETFVTPNGNVEDLEGMISRNSCRTPWFFDDELRVMQVASANMGRTIATVLNWGAHVESMNGRNKYLSSDFPNTARGVLEQEIGGAALYTPSALGASEIIGDSCTRRWHRDTFDGETFPVDAGGEPLAFQDPYNNTDARDRTYAIGRVVGAAALAALQDEAFDPPDAPFEFHGPRLLCFPVNNEGLAALAIAGVIDKPLANAECPTQAGDPPDRAKTSL
jgi:hypothetical protein